MDDGSTDDTQQQVQIWQSQDNGFPIQYCRKENGGLYTAYNAAIAHIDTELCVCIDSDDYMPNDAVEKILTFWQQHRSTEYAGIVGLDFDLSGRVIGDPLPDQKTVNLIDLFIGKYSIHNGDRTNVVRTELYKKVAPMQGFPGEKNFNPHYMHLQISQTHDFLVLNENLRFVDYQEGGMTASIFRQYTDSPNSFAKTRLLYLQFPGTSFKFKVRQTLHLISSCFLAQRPWDAVHQSPFPRLSMLLLPAGWALSRYIKHKAR